MEKIVHKEKVLIIHGWMHSGKRYEQLKLDMEKSGKYEVVLYEFPGFGERRAKYYFNILEQYKNELEKELQSKKYDYVIGHSMGGNILLRILSDNFYGAKLILLSPEYGGIDILKPLIIFYPLLYIILFLVQKIKSPLTTFLIRMTALFTINDWEKIDEQIVFDTRRASTIVALNTMMELAWDSWKVGPKKWENGKSYLILGENDRIIKRNKMNRMMKQIPNIHVQNIPKIGHTAVVENYEELLKMLNIIMEGNKSCNRNL